MKYFRLILFAWWFLAAWEGFRPIGPFASLEQCNWIRSWANSNIYVSQISQCWDDGRK